jgi:hypothetical protein
MTPRTDWQIPFLDALRGYTPPAKGRPAPIVHAAAMAGLDRSLVWRHAERDPSFKRAMQALLSPHTVRRAVVAARRAKVRVAALPPPPRSPRLEKAGVVLDFGRRYRGWTTAEVVDVDEPYATWLLSCPGVKRNHALQGSLRNELTKRWALERQFGDLA